MHRRNEPSPPSSPSCDAVAVHEATLVGQPFLRRLDRREHPRIVGGEESDDRHHEVRGVELVGSERLRERADPVVPALPQDRVTDLLPCPRPRLDPVRGTEAIGQRRSPDRARPSTSASSTRSAGVRRGPPRCRGPSPATAPRRCRRARRGTVACSARARAASSHLPASASGPTRPTGSKSRSDRRCTALEQLAVDVELTLAPRAVAHAHRRRSSPARQVRQLALGQVALAADAEHDLQVAVVVERPGGRRGDVVEELVGFVGTRGHPQRLDGERRVPDPRVAVVPVPGAADALGQRGGGVPRRSPRWAGTTAPGAPVRCDGRGRATGRRTPGAAPTTTATRRWCRPPGRRSRPGSRPAPLPRRRACGDAARTRRCSSLVQRELRPMPTTTRRSSGSGTTARGCRRRRWPAAPPSTASNSGATRPYSGRGTYSTSTLDLALVHGTCRRSRCGASRPRAWPRLPSPMANASTTTAVPVASDVRGLQHHRAIHVSTGAPRSRSRPAATSARRTSPSSRPKIDGLSKRGKHNQSIEPSTADERGAVSIRQQCVVGDRASARRRDAGAWSATDGASRSS